MRCICTLTSLSNWKLFVLYYTTEKRVNLAQKGDTRLAAGGNIDFLTVPKIKERMAYYSE